MKKKLYQEYIEKNVLNEIFVPIVSLTLLGIMAYKAIRMHYSTCYKKCHQGKIIGGYAPSKCQKECKRKRYKMELNVIKSNMNKCDDSECRVKYQKAIEVLSKKIAKKDKQLAR